MNNLSGDLSNKIMLYVSHPCADIIHNSITTRFGNSKMLQTQTKCIPSIKYHTPSILVVRDDTTEEDEIIYESEVVERNIHNTFNLKCITEDTSKHLKQMHHFTVVDLHCIRTLIHGIVVADHNDYADSDSEYSESEHLIYDDDDDYQE